MKKYFTFLLMSFFLLSFVSCNDRDDVIVNDQDTYPKMADVTGSFNAANGYTISQGINIASTDVVLVYRNVNSNTSASPVWQILPKTYYLSSGRELDYNFEFDKSTIEVFTEANFDQATMDTAEMNTYLNNQKFRMVLVPASQAKNADLNYSDYNSVIKFYNLQEPD